MFGQTIGPCLLYELAELAKLWMVIDFTAMVLGLCQGLTKHVLSWLDIKAVRHLVLLTARGRFLLSIHRSLGR